jgi:hypothetical protein
MWFFRAVALNPDETVTEGEAATPNHRTAMKARTARCTAQLNAG